MNEGMRFVELGENLRAMAADFSDDVNERYMLAHLALARLAHDEPQGRLGAPTRGALTEALACAARQRARVLSRYQRFSDRARRLNLI